MNHIIKLILLFLTTISFTSCYSTDKVGTEVEGKVTSDNEGLSNVVVTDGYQCVLTDKDGNFSLTPNSDAKFIYISTPAGYLPAEEMQVPSFYIPIEKGVKQQYDFSLRKNPVDDNRQLLFVTADPQFHKEENFVRYGEVVDDMLKLKEEYTDRDVEQRFLCGKGLLLYGIH